MNRTARRVKQDSKRRAPWWRRDLKRVQKRREKRKRAERAKAKVRKR